jgi:hypothetical protein
MLDSLSVFSLAPAHEIIGRAIGEIFNGIYAVLTECDEHSRRDAWNIP